MKTLSTERLMDTEWAQWKPYNYALIFDPASQTNYCRVGCSAIAVGQLLFYWYKKRGYSIGAPCATAYKSTKSYTVDKVTYTERYNIKSSPSVATFDYNNILNKYKSNNSNSSKIERKAVSEFLAHIGKTLKTNYSTAASSAVTDQTEETLKRYNFNVNRYYPNTPQTLKNNYEQRIKQNIDNGCPVLIRGRDKSSSAGDSSHIWVCDGYKYDSFLGTYDKDGKPQYGTIPNTFNYTSEIQVFLDIYPNYINGDMTNDQEVDSEDIIYIADAFINNLYSTKENQISGDIDYDNKISENDIIYTYNNIVKSEDKNPTSERIVNLVIIEKYCKEIGDELDDINKSMK